MRRAVARNFYLVFGVTSFHFWSNIPRTFRVFLSAIWARIFEARWSRHLITAYALWQYGDGAYASQFVPASGASHYASFGDFFARRLRTMPILTSNMIWPCEGMLCEAQEVSDDTIVNVKGHKRHIRTIFGSGGPAIKNGQFFSNVFLHNRDYHRIHAPISGRITRVEHIPGDLMLLRPWLYKESPSFPALVNERYNVDICAENGETWMLSIVGGPGVATICLNSETKLNHYVQVSEELATFRLGSTCCVISPRPPSKSIGQSVMMGDIF